MSATSLSLRGRCTRRRFEHEAGVTLVELMIAMLLSLVLAGGIVQVYLGNRATYAFTEGLSRMQENGRYALDFVANEVRMAGYFGCLASVIVTDNLSAGTLLLGDATLGVQGFEADGTGTGDEFAATAVDPGAETNENQWTPALPAALDGFAVRGSDVLVVRRAGAGLPLVSPFGNATALYPAQPDPFVDGQILLASDCQKATLFQVTNDPASSTALEHDTGGHVPGNAVGAWPAEQLYGLGAEVAPFEVVAYFVGPGASGTPSLFQSRLRVAGTASGFDAPEELVDGVETLQVRYGQDENSDNMVDAWRTAAEVTDWAQIRAVELSLLVRAAEEYGSDFDTAEYALGGMTFDPVDDRRLRRAFTTVVAIRNRLP